MFTTTSEQTRRFNAEVANLLFTTVEDTFFIWRFENIPGWKDDKVEDLIDPLAVSTNLSAFRAFFSAVVNAFLAAFSASKWRYIGRKSHFSRSTIFLESS
jgi:hypothetical protein